MPTTITSGGSTITPSQVLGYKADREAQSIIHPILGSPNPDVTLRPASLRSGRLELGFEGATSETASKTAADLLSTAVTFNLVSSDRTSIPMPFVVTGSVTRELEEESRAAWMVSFAFQEIA